MRIVIAASFLLCALSVANGQVTTAPAPAVPPVAPTLPVGALVKPPSAAPCDFCGYAYQGNVCPQCGMSRTGASSAGVTMASSQPAQREIPADVIVQPLSLRVSPDGSAIFFQRVNVDREKSAVTLQWQMLDTVSGQVSQVLDALPAKAIADAQTVLDVGPSPRGAEVFVVLGMEKGRMRAVLWNPMKGSVIKLDEQAWLSGRWLDGKVALGSHDGQQVRQIRLFDARGDDKTAKLFATPAAGADNATVLLAVGDAKAPDEKISVRDSARVGLLTATLADGKATGVKALAKVDELTLRPVVSAGGKLAAFSKVPANLPAQTASALATVEVVDLASGKARSISDAAAPIWAGDDGAVLTMSNAGDLKDKLVYLHLPDGSRRLLGEMVKDAVVAGGRLYYISGGNKQILKSLPLEDLRAQPAVKL